MGDVLKLQTNVPEMISLAFSDGMPIASKFGGDQIMFTLEDERRWFVAPFVANKIKAAGIGAGEPFVVCKRERTEGNRRMVEYEIEKGATVTAVAPSGVAVVAGGSSNNSRSQQSSAVAVAPPAAVAVAPPAAAPTLATDSSSAIRFAGMAAIDAVLAVEAYAKSRGMTDFAFGAENIQKVWMTLYIDARKGGRA